MICQLDDDPAEWEGRWENTGSPHEERHDWEEEKEVWDSVSGRKLDPVKVKAAREEELRFIQGKPLYDEVDVSEAWEVTGKAPISTKWVNVDK